MTFFPALSYTLSYTTFIASIRCKYSFVLFQVCANNTVFFFHLGSFVCFICASGFNSLLRSLSSRSDLGLSVIPNQTLNKLNHKVVSIQLFLVVFCWYIIKLFKISLPRNTFLFHPIVLLSSKNI